MQYEIDKIIIYTINLFANKQENLVDYFQNKYTPQ